LRFELVRVELKSLPWSDAVSDAFGRIKSTLEKAGQLIEDFDIAIAAHAVAHHAVLVSSNTKHMKRIKGASLEDWSA
jgi:tRNA(fMet)-specific endonuclease VapC